MKKSLLLFLLLIPSAVSAQYTFDWMYRKYSTDGFTTINISGDMVRSMMQGDVEKDPELMAFTNGIKSIRLIISNEYSRSFAEDMVAVSSSTEYNVLANIRNQADQLVIMYKNKDTRLRNTAYPQSEFLIMQMGEKENFALNILGNLNLRYISNLSKIKIVKMDSFDRFNTIEKDETSRPSGTNRRPRE